jgi:DNA recombination protein Rad52
MAFAQNQLKLLEGKLPEKHVKTRKQWGMSLSYIEGWFAIAEANRIFGFDGWDREMIQAECVWQDGRGATKLCAYTARVRIRVRAGETIIQRDGSGVGQGSGATLGEAHESALKEAETDATKRALTTFGNLFGLALYDREQAGVRRAPRPREHSALVMDGSEPWILLGARGELISNHDSAESYCAALRRTVDQAVLPRTLKSLWYYNEPTLQRLRLARPELKTGKGVHYADLLERYAERAKQRLGQPRRAHLEPELLPPEPIDKSALPLGAPRRLRDPEHLRFINVQPCLICGRAPVHAHHLRFAQPRSMGNKVSDEWAVPLCFTHHRALHTFGNEEAWWVEKGIDAKAEAQRLWRQGHGTPEPTDVEDSVDKRRSAPGGAPGPAPAAEAGVAGASATATVLDGDRTISPAAGASAAVQEPRAKGDTDRSRAPAPYHQTHSVIVPDHGNAEQAVPETNIAAHEVST